MSALLICVCVCVFWSEVSCFKQFVFAFICCCAWILFLFVVPCFRESFDVGCQILVERPKTGPGGPQDLRGAPGGRGLDSTHMALPEGRRGLDSYDMALPRGWRGLDPTHMALPEGWRGLDSYYMALPGGGVGQADVENNSVCFFLLPRHLESNCRANIATFFI